MERVLRRPTVFILAISLILGMFVSPIYADEAGGGTSPVYKEASIANEVDTGFEKQNEIAEVKSQSCDGVRTLSSDSYRGRFSLKIGKSGLTDSVLCHLISSEIDLSKYNQVSMWVKPKGYNIPLTVYTQSNGQQTTVGSIEVSNLKADIWQEISFDLSFASGQITGLYTYAYPGKSLLIDDVRFSKTHTNSEAWDLNAGGSSNTLPTIFSYQDNLGITMKTSTTSSSAYENGAKVASIENAVPGEITGIKIDSAKSELEGSMIPTGGAMYLEGFVAMDSDRYTISADGKLIYYYNPSTNCVERKNLLTNESSQIYEGQIKMIKTNEDGSRLALVSTSPSLFLVENTKTIDSTNFYQKAVPVTDSAISMLFFKRDNLYFACNNVLYLKGNGDSCVAVSDFIYFDRFKVDADTASLISGSKEYRYYYYVTIKLISSYHAFLVRKDNLIPGDDVTIWSVGIASTQPGKYGIVKANRKGNMVIFHADGHYYLIVTSDTSPTQTISIDGAKDMYFFDDKLIYTLGNQAYIFDYVSRTTTAINKINYSIDANGSSGQVLYVESYSDLYMGSKTYNYDKELIARFSAQPVIVPKPASNAAIISTKFSTLPNQAIAQMENGDIYSIDTRTKTNRLIISGMVFHDVLDQGRLLLSDMKDTGRFLIYDPTSNSKEVFRLDNRSNSAAFTVQFNEEAKTVYYLNNENKMQVRLLTGAETQDKYAIMMNNDNKWWVYKNNAWKNIYTGSDAPSVEIMGSMGMTAAELNAVTEKDFKKLPENAKADTLRIAVYLHSSSPYATPVLKSINVSTKDTEADLEGKTLYGARIKEYNKADFRDISAIHVIENKDSTDAIYYFLIVDGTLYSIRNGEACEIGKSEAQMFVNIKDNYMDVMSYGMSAKELADFPADSLKKILITDNTTDRFGIAAVMKTIDKDTKEVKLDYALESLKKRFVDEVTTIKITLTDDTQIQYTSGEVSKEEIEKFTDWVMDRKYNRGPVFFTFHVGNQYKIINYYMIKMFSVE